MSSESHREAFWILGCLIVLTLVGIFLTIMVDRHRAPRRQTSSIQSRLHADGESILNLRNQISRSEAKLTASATNSEASQSELNSREADIKEISASIQVLKSRKRELTAELPDTREKFQKYREDYRKHTWRNAVGEKIDHIFLRTGRQFDRVVVTKVTPSGLEISHAHGRARIDGKDLSHALQDRFQWFGEGREKVSRKKPVEKISLPTEAKIPNRGIETAAPAEAGKAQAIAEAKALVTTGRNAVATLSRNHAEAVSNSRYNSQRSVPGSLRTWAEQAVILEKKLAAAIAKLSTVTEQLRQLSPTDPLLQAAAP